MDKTTNNILCYNMDKLLTNLGYNETERRRIKYHIYEGLFKGSLIFGSLGLNLHIDNTTYIKNNPNFGILCRTATLSFCIWIYTMPL